MPSLRRTMSSPSVRSSPYPSLASGNGSSTRPGYSHRRSSGSEIATRRVLADIEWWRVTDGQHDLEAEQESVDNNRDQEQVDPAMVQPLDARPNTTPVPSTVLQFSPLTSDGYPFSPTDEYSVLAIPPQTPPRRRFRETSLESTPEAPEAPVESLRLGMEYLDLGLSSQSSNFAALPASTRNSVVSENNSSLSVRHRSLVDCLSSLQNESLNDYAESPLSSGTPNIFN